MKKKRILYISHVEWGWIKQRPHFIAEGLNEEYNVDYFCRRKYRGKGCENLTKINLIRPLALPFERFSIIRYINSLIVNLYLKIILKRYNIIWITCPNDISYNALRQADNDQIVIYDCMDDMLEFGQSKDEIERVRNRENHIFNSANLVFCSAEYLKKKLQNRYGNRKVVVVNNALYQIPNYLNVTMDNLPLHYKKSSHFKIVYIGTISEWMDVELIRSLVEKDETNEVFLFGPYKENMKALFNIPRIHLMGAIEHHLVNSVMLSADILIMPFVLNELILSVNPVKLYEYIASGKPCLAPLYSESEYFADYCHLYNTKEDCERIIKDIKLRKVGPKKTMDQCLEFAMRNTWDKRVSYMLNHVNTILDGCE